MPTNPSNSGCPHCPASCSHGPALQTLLPKAAQTAKGALAEEGREGRRHSRKKEHFLCVSNCERRRLVNEYHLNKILHSISFVLEDLEGAILVVLERRSWLEQQERRRKESLEDVTGRRTNRHLLLLQHQFRSDAKN